MTMPVATMSHSRQPAEVVGRNFSNVRLGPLRLLPSRATLKSPELLAEVDTSFWTHGVNPQMPQLLEQEIFIIPEEEYYEIVPSETVAGLAARHRERSARIHVKPADYVDIDIPFIDDGADW